MPDLSFVAPMEARLVAELPADEGWQFEPKWDGFRCIAIKDGTSVELWAKSGKPLGRYFPEVVAMMGDLPGERLMLDGELIVSVDGQASFDALQQRLHPAESRVRKLAVETPALLVAFDLLHHEATAWRERALSDRRQALEALFETIPRQVGLRLSPTTQDPGVARHWFEELSRELDGVIAKRLDEPYVSGKRAMLKIKRIRTADCVVGGFRYGTGSRLVGSLLLGLFDAEGRLDHVGFTSGISGADKPAITGMVESLTPGVGFTGKAPGGPSRWSTERSDEWEPLRHELVVEVAYDQITGHRFRHGARLVRWRPDKAPQQCTMDQLVQPADVDASITATMQSAGRS